MKRKKPGEMILWFLCLQICELKRVCPAAKQADLQKLEAVGLRLFQTESWSEIFHFSVSSHTKVRKPQFFLTIEVKHGEKGP